MKLMVREGEEIMGGEEIKWREELSGSAIVEDGKKVWEKLITLFEEGKIDVAWRGRTITKDVIDVLIEYGSEICRELYDPTWIEKRMSEVRRTLWESYLIDCHKKNMEEALWPVQEKLESLDRLTTHNTD